MSVETAEGAETGSEAGGAATAVAGAEAAASADFPLVGGASGAPPEAAGVAV